jgi:CheY-like chemotaxis protein
VQKKILVIEDEFDIASTIELALEMEDYDVRLSSNGKEALHILDSEALPDLIVSDVMMPVMDGYEFTKLLRNNPRYDKIPLLLTSAAKLDLKLIEKKNYQSFIRKPFDLHVFLDMIHQILS